MKLKIVSILGYLKNILFICEEYNKKMAMKKWDFSTMASLIKQNVLEVDNTAEVWIYGSRVRGDAHEESDWDVLVLSSKDKLTFQEEEKFMDLDSSLCFIQPSVFHDVLCI